MNSIFAAARELEMALQARGFRYCFIGGVAVQRWGQPRMTADVFDLTLLTGFGTEARYVDALLEVFSPRIEDARTFALDHRTLLLKSNAAGIPLDVSLGAMPFEERAVDRASAFPISKGASITTCSAEDLIVHKAFAAREKDWLDIRGIAIRRRKKLDEELIWGELLPLLELKEDMSAEKRLREIP